MSEIVPRWEWRTFGDRFRTADAVFATHEPTQVHDTDELYLLAPGANNVKIRDDLMDIKVLRDVDTLRALEAGLESFPGCAVVISHDRWFLDRIATHILAFEGEGKVRWFEGNHQAYMEKRR